MQVFCFCRTWVCDHSAEITGLVLWADWPTPKRGASGSSVQAWGRIPGLVAFSLFQLFSTYSFLPILIMTVLYVLFCLRSSNGETWNGSMIMTCMSCEHEQLLVQCLCICPLKAQLSREKFYRTDKVKKALFETETIRFFCYLCPVFFLQQASVTPVAMLLLLSYVLSNTIDG